MGLRAVDPVLEFCMCAAFELNSRMIRPGKLVGLWQQTGRTQLVWAGFARNESARWWKSQGGELVDVPAQRFAERSDRDRKLRWDDVPAGLVIRGVLVPNEGKPLLKIVTRASTEDELQRFEHPRMPLIELPFFSAEPFDVPDDSPQAELF
jgi:hypothetical protein